MDYKMTKYKGINQSPHSSIKEVENRYQETSVKEK